MEQVSVDTKPLLRPAQLADALHERKSLDEKFKSPHIADKGEVVRQMRRMDAMLDTQTPKAFEGRDKDAAVRLEADLRAKILDGMPSQEEMRKSPPGAVEKHIAWEARNGEDILRWKNLQLRLHAGDPDGSVANFEKYRPRGSSLNMDGAMVSGSMHFLPPPGTAPGVVFNEGHMKLLGELDPGLLDRLATLTNEERAELKAALEGVGKAKG